MTTGWCTPHPKVGLVLEGKNALDDITGSTEHRNR